MKLRPELFLDEVRCVSLFALIPEADGPEDRFPEWTEVMFTKKPHTVSGAILDMAALFNAEKERRTRLQHDCGVFALACVTGDSWRDVACGDGQVLPEFTLSGLRSPKDYPEGITNGVGQVVLLHKVDADGEYVPRSHHFMVQASMDGQPPLYASRMGPSGFAVLHSFSWAAAYYQADFMSDVQFAMNPTLAA